MHFFRDSTLKNVKQKANKRKLLLPAKHTDGVLLLKSCHKLRQNSLSDVSDESDGFSTLSLGKNKNATNATDFKHVFLAEVEGVKYRHYRHYPRQIKMFNSQSRHYPHHYANY